jgi:hypothetical protein
MTSLYQPAGRTSRPVIWTIKRIHGNEVETVWGQEGGKQQQTVQTFEAVNVGKANQKTPEQVAQEFMDRQILKKKREGFLEEGQKAPELSITFDSLPQALRFYKPQNNLNGHLIKLIGLGKAWFVRKRNGEMMVACRGSGDVALYSSKLLPVHKNDKSPWAARFPDLVEELQVLMPHNTILLGEMVADPVNDDLLRVGSVMKSLLDRGLELQKGQPLHYCIWDVAFWVGQDMVKTVPYRERFHHIQKLVDGQPPSLLTYPVITYLEHQGPVDPQVIMEDMRKSAKELGWEGYVVVDPDAMGYRDKAYNFHGKAERPLFCGKLKPKFEADFIVRWDPDNGIGTWGKGKKSKGVGAVFAYLWDPIKCEEVFVSKVGGGLSDEDVARFANPDLYPMVWQVEFASWTPDGSIQFPEFVRVREDKLPHECTTDQRPEPEEDA